VKSSNDLGQAAAVLHATAHPQGEALPGLLEPRVVAHARDDEHAVWRDTQQPGVGEHEADQGRDHASLACLHLCCQVNPRALDLCDEEIEKALHGRQDLGLVGIVRRLRLGHRPAKLGHPEGGGKACSRHLQISVRKRRSKALGCHCV